MKNRKNIPLYAVCAAAAVLIGVILGYGLGLFLTIWGAMNALWLMVLGIILLSVGWIPLMGLKVLKPQEALVLTLFGKYIGTLKGDGFYFVNPLCTAVNPAAWSAGAVAGAGAADWSFLLPQNSTVSTTMPQNVRFWPSFSLVLDSIRPSTRISRPLVK